MERAINAENPDEISRNECTATLTFWYSFSCNSLALSTDLSFGRLEFFVRSAPGTIASVEAR
jgi:hypothetical protein